jgi:uncharacterized protein (TIGR02444 family)
VPNNPFWQYSLKLYSQIGVESSLLILQDDYGADVNVLLCCCWLGALQQELTIEQCSKLVAVSASWRAECVTPLRSVRRFLRTRPENDDLRNRAKALELEAEREQQILMYQALESLGLISVNKSGKDCSANNLRVYCHTMLEAESPAMMQTVKQLLSQISSG